MRYNMDANGYLANYATLGDVENGVEYPGELPQGFADCPRAYRLSDGVLTLDADRLAALTAAQAAQPDTTETRLAAAETTLQTHDAEIEQIVTGLEALSNG